MLRFNHICCQVSALITCCAVCSCEIVTDALPAQQEQEQEQEQPEPNATAIYTIKKGSHYADLKPYKKQAVERLRFSVLFDSTAIYRTADPANQRDMNKLYGLSDCGSDHHSNSARFGWRWFNDQLELYAYVYHNTVREQAYIGTVTLGAPAICGIRLENNQYLFTMNGSQISLPRACSGKGDGYQLYPYFAGDEVAPHDITIVIEELPPVK